jgi:hypothetical protein
MKCSFCGEYDNPKNMYIYPNGATGYHRKCNAKNMKEWSANKNGS